MALSNAAESVWSTVIDDYRHGTTCVAIRFADGVVLAAQEIGDRSRERAAVVAVDDPAVPPDEPAHPVAEVDVGNGCQGLSGWSECRRLRPDV